MSEELPKLIDIPPEWIIGVSGMLLGGVIGFIATYVFTDPHHVWAEAFHYAEVYIYENCDKQGFFYRDKGVRYRCTKEEWK